MTIICYRDGVLAADSLVTIDAHRAAMCRKIVRHNSGVMGGAAGPGYMCRRFLAWIAGGAEGEFSIKPDDRDSFGALMITADGVPRYLGNDGSEIAYGAPWFALGACEGLAMGAMAMGASAEKAVEISIHYSVWCGGPVQVERFG